MSFVHGKNAVIKITDATGDPLDISGYSNEVDFPVSIDTAETSHFGSQAKTYVVGLDDGTISIKGMFDAAIDLAVSDAIAAILAGTQDAFSVEIAPAGDATGSPKYTMLALPTGYEVDAPVGDMVSFSLDLQRTGGTTRSVYA